MSGDVDGGLCVWERGQEDALTYRAPKRSLPIGFAAITSVAVAGGAVVVRDGRAGFVVLDTEQLGVIARLPHKDAETVLACGDVVVTTGGRRAQAFRAGTWEVVGRRDRLGAGTQGYAWVPAANTISGGWPDDAATTQAAIADALETMGRRGAWEDLGLMWASERFLGVYWPRIADTVRDRLAERTWSTVDDLYPAQDSTGALFLADTRSLAGMRLFSPGTAGFAEFLRLAAASTYTVGELRAVARLWWERPLPADFRPARPSAAPASTPQNTAPEYPEVAVPLERQDPTAVQILERMVGRLAERFTVVPVRSGHGYRVVDLRTRDTDRIFTQIPAGTLLTTVSLRHSGKPEDLGDYAELKQAIRDRGRPQEQYREIRRYVGESIDEIAADKQPEKAVPARPPTPAESAALDRALAAADAMISPPPPNPPARDLGRFYRVGDRWFGDTALIPSTARHMLYGDFQAKVPGGELYFSRRDDKQLPGQSGRLHELSLREGTDLPGILEGLAAAGLAQSGGTWDDWPRPAGDTDTAPSAPLAEVPPPDDDTSDDEPSPSRTPEPEPDLLAPPPVSASAGELAFTVDAKELQGALNLIRRVSVASDEKLSLVQIECRGHVFFRVGSLDQYFELRFTSTRCISPGDATVASKDFAARTKHLTAGALQVQKKPHEAVLQVGLVGRQVSVPTVEYVPVRLDADLTGDARIPLDDFMGLLDRTLFAVSTDANRPQLHMLAFIAEGQRLTAIASNGHMLALASIDTPDAIALADQRIAYPALVRLQKLLQEYEKTVRPGRRRKDAVSPPLRIQTSSTGPKRLALATELFTFVAARAPAEPIPYQAVIPKAGELTTVCVLSRAELFDAMKPIAAAKELSRVQVGSPLAVTSDTFSFNLRDVFVDGPGFEIGINAAYMRDALEGLRSSGPLVALAFTTPLQPIVVISWPDSALPKSRRDARGPVLAALESNNITIVMPYRLGK